MVERQESAVYRARRQELLQAEIALKDQMERVAALRRGLPLDTAVEDYTFREGPRDRRESQAKATAEAIDPSSSSTSQAQ